MVPAEKLVRVANETEKEPEGVVFNVQVAVKKFKFLADIVVVEKTDCLLTLGRSFLAIEKARIKLEYKEIVLRERGHYLIHQFPQDNIRRYIGTECHAVEDVNPYNSHEDIKQTRADQEKCGAANNRRMDVREGATGSSWRKTPYENFRVGDPVLLRHPKEFY